MKLNYAYMDKRYGVDFGELNVVKQQDDYNALNNKPTINSVELNGALTARDLGLGEVYYDTKENWALQPDLIAERGAIYIYSNASTYVDDAGNAFPIAALKIGDGTSYLIDMPFTSDSSSATVFNHLADDTIHVSVQDRLSWNNKVSSYLDAEDMENLVLSKDNYVVDGDVLNQ